MTQVLAFEELKKSTVASPEHNDCLLPAPFCIPALHGSPYQGCRGRA